MHFAISIPQHVPDGTFDPAQLRDYLTRAESLDFHSAWTQEMILGSAPALAPLELMTFAAACTERLRLGCAVFVSPLHNPVHLAKSISSSARCTILSTSPKVLARWISSVVGASRSVLPPAEEGECSPPSRLIRPSSSLASRKDCG